MFRCYNKSKKHIHEAIKITLFFIASIFLIELLFEYLNRCPCCGKGHMMWMIKSLFIVSSFLVFLYKISNLFKIAFETYLNKEKNILSYKITYSLMQNIDHQLMSPLIAVRNAFEENNKIIKTLVSSAKKNGKRNIDRIVYGCSEQTKDCENCTLTGYCSGEVKLIQDIQTNTSLIENSINNMFETLGMIKSIKDNKLKNQDSLYNIASNVFSMFSMFNKYNFDYYISEELKFFYLTTMKPVEMLNVLNNHIQNSLDANASIVKIKYISYDYENKMLTFYIIDNGEGIPADVVGNIWDLGKSTKGDGRGFGMYLCKEIINSANGNEEIVSSDENGTIIKITVPAKKETK